MHNIFIMPAPYWRCRLFIIAVYKCYNGIHVYKTGSRAVVMECQYGPRRKGSLAKKQMDVNAGGEYKQTCPARWVIVLLSMGTCSLFC